MIQRTIDALLEGGVDEVVVVVGPESPRALTEVLHALPVRAVLNPDPDRGMFSSIHAGLAVADGSPVLVLPADMPFVTAGTVGAVIAECVARDRVVVPAIGDRHGHPVAMPAAVARTIAAGPSHGTLKEALRAAAGPPVELQMTDPGILRDVDVPADLSRA